MSTVENAPLAFETCHQLMNYWAERSPEKVAIQCLNRQTSFASLQSKAAQISNALRENFEVGSRIGILARNSDRYIFALLGAAAAGMVAVVLNWRLAPRELATIAADANLALLLAEDEFQSSVEMILAQKPETQFISLANASAQQCEFDAFYETCSSTPGPQSNADAPAIILYTSGTTGLPKGIVQSQRKMQLLVSMTDAPGKDGNCREEDVNILSTPLFHLAGVAWTLMSTGRGGTLIVPPIFEMDQLGAVIEEFGITRATILPAMMPSLLKAADEGRDLSSLRLICYGASAIPEDLLSRMIDRFKCSFLQTYGMSEITGSATYLAPEEHYPGNPRLLSCGRAYPGFEIEIVEADSHGVGEIAIKGPSIMLGYWGNPGLTAQVVRDGWYHTGDMGLLDADGFLYIRDRKKDMIISGGENIYSAEVEAAVREHPSIAAAAVVGVPSEKWGEEPKGFLVLVPGRAFDRDEMIGFLRDRIAGYKIPRSYEILDSLPVTALGKIAKEELRAPYWKGVDRRVN